MPTEKLISGHRRFRGQFAASQDLFGRLARHGQRPAVMWIGCSDSRVIPELITAADPGDLFVVRNIAGIVPPAGSIDRSVGAAVEYAITQLAVEHVVVCGHTECGGLAALLGGTGGALMPHTVGWLEHARPALGSAGAAGSSPGPALVRAHVRCQHDNLLTYPCIAEARAGGRLATHAWVYDVHSGAVSAQDGESWRDLDQAASGHV